MPVHEVRYRPWSGEWTPGLLRLAAIPKYTLMAAATRGFSTLVFGGGSLLLLVIAVYLYLFNNQSILALFNLAGGDRLPAFAPDWILSSFLEFQVLFAAVAALMAGPRMVSSEMRHQALPLLFSRPLTRTGYIAGKAAALLAPLGYLLAAQSLAIGVLMMALYPMDSPFWESFWTEGLPLVAASAATGLGMALVVSLVALACSALARNPSFAGGLFLALYFGSTVVSRLAADLLDKEGLRLGLSGLLRALPKALLHSESAIAPGPVVAVLAAWALLALGVLYWRIRPLEVHSS